MRHFVDIRQSGCADCLQARNRRPTDYSCALDPVRDLPTSMLWLMLSVLVSMNDADGRGAVAPDVDPPTVRRDDNAMRTSRNRDLRENLIGACVEDRYGVVFEQSNIGFRGECRLCGGHGAERQRWRAATNEQKCGQAGKPPAPET